MADLGRISGPMLKDNLLRGGVDLVFENRLGDNNLYIDVNTNKIGVNTDSITRELTINDSALTDFLIVDNTYTSKNVTFTGSTIDSLLGDLIFNPANGVTNLSSIASYGIKIDDNVIQSLNSNETLEFRPDGTGAVNFRTDVVNVDGNLHSTGDITLDGTITIGNSDTDSVTFASDIDSNIIPDQDITFDLGSNTKKWLGLYTEFVNGQQLQTSGISVSGVNEISLRQGKIWYVATNGLDSNVGDHQNGPYATIETALSVAVSGDTVMIYPGTYEENFPLIVPTGVTVKGFGIRSVKIIPTTATNDLDAFLINGETTVSDLTVADFFYNSTNNTGYAFRFANNLTVTSRSPYIQNVSVITESESTFASAGRGAYIDGAVVNASSKEASMLFHSVTMIVPDADAVVMTNGVRVEWLNSFIYFANRGLYAINGTLGFASQGIRFGAEIRSIGSANVYGTFGAVADGANTIMYLINHNFAYIGSGLNSTNDPSDVIQANETVELNSGKIYYQSLDHKGTYRVGDIFVVNLETGEISIDGVSTSLGGVTSLEFADDNSVTFIDATTVDANNIRISGNTISSISGDVNVTAQSNEVNLTQNVNAAKNLDITGNFSIDGQLTIGNQIVDTVSFVSKLDENLIPKFDNTYSIGSTSLKWDASNIENIELDNLKFFDNRIKTIETNSDLELVASSTGRIYSSGTDVEIDQNLTVEGISNLKNTTVQGTIAQTGNIIQIGNSFQTGDYALTGTLTVSNNFITEDISFIDNRVTTNNSNSDLDLRAVGSGRFYVPDSSVTFDQDLTVLGLTTTSNISNSDTVTADKFYVDDVLVRDNYITTYNSNSNLELTANNTGGVFLETLKFTDNTISTVSGNTNISIASLSTGSVLINDEKALQLPVGTALARPTGIQGDFRYDSTDGLFSGWSSNRVTFGGVFSADRRTRLTAHPTNDTLNFVTNLVATMEITQTGIRTNGLGTGNNLLFNNNTISTLTVNSDINLTPNGTGQTDLGNIHIYQNEFINQLNTPMTFVNTGGGHVKFGGSKALQIPAGPSSERPFTEAGDLRWNTDNNATEVFDGINYVSIAGVTESASAEQVQELNEIYAILLG
jgi:hypothetical protein